MKDYANSDPFTTALPRIALDDLPNDRCESALLMLEWLRRARARNFQTRTPSGEAVMDLIRCGFVTADVFSEFGTEFIYIRAVR